MRKLSLFILLFITACGGNSMQEFEIQNTPEFGQVQQMEIVAPTETPVPTATLDVVSTLDASKTQIAIAQATANMAIAYSIQATNDEEARLYGFAQMTREANQLTAQSDMYTQQAYPTTVPLTQTAQQILDEQIGTQQALFSIGATQTKEAPDNAIKISNAEHNAKYGWIETMFIVIAMLTMSFFFVMAGLWMYKNPPRKQEEEIPFIVPIVNHMAKPNAVVEIKSGSDTPYPTSNKIVFPVTDEQMDEFADKIINQGKSLAFDNFTGHDSRFTRKTYKPLYQFMAENKLAKFTGVDNKGLILTDSDFGEVNGRAILEAWLAYRKLPEGWETLGSERGSAPLSAPPPEGNDPKTGISQSDYQPVQVGRVQDKAYPNIATGGETIV